jgi:hypothetical protein
MKEKIFNTIIFALILITTEWVIISTLYVNSWNANPLLHLFSYLCIFGFSYFIYNGNNLFPFPSKKIAKIIFMCIIHITSFLMAILVGIIHIIPLD